MGDLEEAFTSEILSHPDRNDTRLVYADWLEDKGDEQSLARATFLRLECALQEVSSETQGERIRQQIISLTDHLGVEWLATFSRLDIYKCPHGTNPLCPKAWEYLRLTPDATIRTCSACQSLVHFCPSREVLVTRLGERQCVVIPHGVELSTSGLPNPGSHSWWTRFRRLRNTLAWREEPPSICEGVRIRVKRGRYGGLEGEVEQLSECGREVSVSLVTRKGRPITVDLRIGDVEVCSDESRKSPDK